MHSLSDAQLKAATGAVTNKIRETRHGPSFLTEIPKDSRLVTTYFGPSGLNTGYLKAVWPGSFGVCF